MDYLWSEFSSYANRMNSQQWLLVVAAAITVGIFCMRGLGTRSY